MPTSYTRGSGDGAESMDHNPQYTFATFGIYAFTLTVENVTGRSVKAMILK
ncbi:MAG TPA: PKD domain-containing protein [Candidatus Methanomethylophilaceae archaeon]|nr:PKD domain-containing protein [Candidatus Methanomethylophilaceae archaeon]